MCRFVAVCTYCHEMPFVGKRCKKRHGNMLFPRKVNCGNKDLYCNNRAGSCHNFPRGITRLSPQFWFVDIA